MEKGEKLLYIPDGIAASEFKKYVGTVVEVISDNNHMLANVRAEDGCAWCTSISSLKPVPNTNIGTADEYPELTCIGEKGVGVNIRLNDHGIDALRYGLSLTHTPDHYAVGGIDVWKYAEMKFSTEANVGFHIINIVKYVTRYEHKNGLKDLIKARDSINKAIELLEQQQPKKDAE